MRNLSESQLARALRGVLEPNAERARIRIPTGPGGRSARLPDLGRAMRNGRLAGARARTGEPLPPSESMLPDPAAEVAQAADDASPPASDATPEPDATPAPTAVGGPRP